MRLKHLRPEHVLNRPKPGVQRSGILPFIIPILFFVLSGFNSLAIAAETPENVTVYTANYFDNLNVLTARDMVRRIPGSEAEVPQRRRGRGSQRRGLRDKTDSVLINGKKLIGKSNDADDFLRRLPASMVVRIEVVDGIVTETESDAGSRTVNIITTSDNTGSGTWATSLKWVDDLRLETGASMSYTKQLKTAAISLGLAVSPRGSLRLRDDIEYVSDIPVERSIKTRRRYSHGRELTASVHVPLSDSRTLRVNASWQKNPRKGGDDTEVFEYLPNGTQSLIEYSEDPSTWTWQTWELGGTYEQQLNDADLLQLLFLRNESEIESDSKKSTFDTNGQIIELNRETRDEEAEETVLRGTWFSTRDSGSQFDIGLELAVNTLDKTTALFEGISEPLPQVPIPNADQVIRENRAELFANYSFSYSKTRVRLGLAVEYSEFDQQGSDVSQSRTLDYVKPSVNLSYDRANNNRLFLTFKRDVSQLNFDDFIAYIDPFDDEIRAGNPDLLPETSWDLEVGSEYHYGAGAGLLKLRLFHRWVEDVEDLVPLDLDDSQPGNLPDGRHWGINVIFGLRLEKFGLPGAAFNGFYTWQDSKVIDPFTGDTRQFINKERYEAGFEYRHDLEQFRGAYGFSWSGEGREYRYDVDRTDIKIDADAIQMFVERRVGNALILKLSARQIYEPMSRRTRLKYDPDRATGIQTPTEKRIGTERRSVTLTLSGTF